MSSESPAWLVDWKRLDKERETRGLTWGRIARLLHMQPSSFTRWAARVNEPDLPSLVKLAEFFNLSLDVLVIRPSIVRRPKTTPEAESKTYVLNDKEEAAVLAHRSSPAVRKLINTVVSATADLTKEVTKRVKGKRAHGKRPRNEPEQPSDAGH